MEDDPIATPSTIRASLAGALGCLLLSGCAHLYDPIDEAVTCLHCEKQALHTWAFVRDHYACVNFPHHFGEGFRAGYVDVCRGGSGCPPTLPPKCYWSFWYRNTVGRAKTVEWFNGFAAGAAAARQEGLDQFGQLVTATEIHGQCGCEPLEYDLSDLPTSELYPQPDDSQQVPPPIESDPEMPSASNEWPPAVPPTLAFPPAPPAWGHSQPQAPTFTAAPAQEPSPAPNSVHLDLPPVPAEPIDSTPEPAPPAQQVPEPTDAVDLPAGLPFGHSLLPSNTSTLAPPPQERQTLDRDSDPATPDSEPNEPAAEVDPNPFLDAKPDPPSASSTPAARRPERMNRLPGDAVSPAPVPPAQPEEDFIPLEDRFLPRPDQEPVARPVSDSSVDRRRRPRSLFDMMNRIEQTSHQTGRMMR